MAKIVWQPQPKQVKWMQRPEYEALYGGAAGGGKSDAMLAEALRQVDIPHYRAIIFRKTYPQLSELIDRSREIYSLAYPKARFNESKHCWVFPSGAKIFFGSMQHTKDRTNYQGKRYDFVGFDELTHFTWEEYSYMFSRNRPSKSPRSNKKTRVYIRATTNPGGIGHGWVKDRFITAADPFTTIVEEVEVTKPDGSKQIIKRDRVFIPATIFDNQVLLEQDPNYLGSLALLPEKERNALLYGDWDTFSGQYFEEFREHPDTKQAAEHGCTLPIDVLRQRRMWCHVIDPFDMADDVHRAWPIYRSYDFGYNRPASLGYWTVDYDGVVYRIMEVYFSNGNPNEGKKWNPDQQFAYIAELEHTHPWLKGRQIDGGVADPACWNTSMGISVAETAANYGIYFTPGENDRISGWQQLHYRLQFDCSGKARMYVFRNCKDWIRTIPLMMYDDTKVEDLDSSLEDHAADETRYFLQSRPIKPLRPVETQQIYSDPLDQFKRRNH